MYHSLLGVLAKLQTAIINYAMSVRPSVSHWTDFQEVW